MNGFTCAKVTLPSFSKPPFVAVVPAAIVLVPAPTLVRSVLQLQLQLRRLLVLVLFWLLSTLSDGAANVAVVTVAFVGVHTNQSANRSADQSANNQRSTTVQPPCAAVVSSSKRATLLRKLSSCNGYLWLVLQLLVLLFVFELPTSKNACCPCWCQQFWRFVHLGCFLYICDHDWNDSPHYFLQYVCLYRILL